MTAGAASRSLERAGDRARLWLGLLSAAVLAGATIATSWSAYQSSMWSARHAAHNTAALAAIVKGAKFNTLALQRTTVHVNLFVQWITAVNRRDRRTADFLFERFPEPLKSATTAWRATRPRTLEATPGSPFDRPEYILVERSQADQWEAVAARESADAQRADEVSTRYLMFTTIFATVLFFAGISGKCNWPIMDNGMLIIGVVTLIGGLAAIASLPRA